MTGVTQNEQNCLTFIVVPQLTIVDELGFAKKEIVRVIVRIIIIIMII